jgi:hypothetical protein
VVQVGKAGEAKLRLDLTMLIDNKSKIPEVEVALGSQISGPRV